MRIVDKIIKASIERRLLKTLAAWLREETDILLSIPARKWLAATSKVQKNKVMFMTYNNDYMCNPKYICEEIRHQNLPLDLVWVSTQKKIRETDQYPEGVRIVVRNSYEFFKEMATAKIWIDNAICFTWTPMPKSKEQYYIETWHGSMGLKRIGRNDIDDKSWLKAAERCGKYVDVCISNSTFETEVFRETHWPHTHILELGHARNDILFCDKAQQQEIKQKVCSFYNIPFDSKIALYAPTFRDGAGIKYYNMDYPRLLKSLEARFEGNWYLLNRFHFKTKGHQDINKHHILDATTYPDIQELMVASDVGITDYSSWICDFILTEKPGFIYASDISSYNQERGFYYPLSSTPFPVAETNDELEKNIINFDTSKYLNSRKQFLQDRGCKEDGHAAEKIVEIIKRECLL